VKLLIYSDLHLEFSNMDVPVSGYDAVVLAGDIDLGSKGAKWAKTVFPNIPVIYVCGNHEYYHGAIESVHQKIRQEIQGSSVHFCENQSTVIDEIRFIGATLWTDLGINGNPQQAFQLVEAYMNDYRQITYQGRLLSAEDTWGFHQASRHYIRRQSGNEKESSQKTVIVTHHAPSKSSLKFERVHPFLSPAYASAMDDMIAQSGAKLWIHGHTHESVDYYVGNTRVVSNPRGYSHQNNGIGNANFRVKYIVDV